MKKNTLFFLLGAFLFIISIFYFLFFASNTLRFSTKKYVYIRTGSDYETFIKEMKDSNVIHHWSLFESVAKLFSLPKNIHPGRYEIQEGMGNFSIVNMFKKGHQSEVKLVLNKLKTKQDIIRKLSSQLEPDSNSWSMFFADTQFLQKYQIDSNQIQALFIPNTYYFYWNTTPNNVMEKLASYKIKFWNETRMEQAKQLNLSPMQIIIIASIVDEETNKNDEKPKIASVYLNRFRKGMKLGADPTVKFAVGDFSLRRILNIHLKKESPYNTYLVSGLPPGPICTPSESSINAVLKNEKTDYLFFCAKEDFSGYHNFANTYQEHLANAKRFQEVLNQKGIK